MLRFLLWFCGQRIAFQENSNLSFTAHCLYCTFGALGLGVSLNLALLPAEVFFLHSPDGV